MKISFSFGKNWTRFARTALDEKALMQGCDSLKKYLPAQEFQGKTFIDIGCGSGVFSFGALFLGCKKVISFDIDPDSIRATQHTKKTFEKFLPAHTEWEISQNSILDETTVNRYREQGDIVYSWGVLHHTGRMWEALANAASCVKKNGYFILAIYNKAPSSHFWLRFKKFYNRSPRWTQKIMVGTFFSYLLMLRFGGNIIARFRGKPKPFASLTKRERGMSVFYDLIDWLGGLPYEFATHDEMKAYMEPLGFRLIASPTNILPLPGKLLNRFSFNGTGNNEFVFQKIS